MTNIETLPVELLDSIFGYIVRPSDLKALCLVSKAVSETAFRHLYQTIILPHRSDDRDWTRVDCLSRSSHLHHVQAIDIGQSDDGSSPSFCRNLQPLLQRLPVDALKDFTYGLHGRPQAEDLVTVWREQRGLRRLQLDFNLCAPSLREMVHDLQDDLRSLASLEELEVDFGQEEDEASSSALLAGLQTGKLRSIHLQFFGVEAWAAPSRSFEVSTIGVTLIPQHFPRTLSTISLSFLALPSPRDWNLNEYNALLALELHECTNVEPILSSLQKPRLKHFHVERRIRTNEIQLYLAIRDFVKRFGSLETLTVNIDVKADNGEQLVPAIREHGLHLRSLRVDGYAEEPGPLVLHDNLETYPKLKYLALPLRRDVMVVERCKRVLRQVPHLEILIVCQSNPSIADSDIWRDEDSRLAYTQECATKVFSCIPTGSKLRLLIFSREVNPLFARVERQSLSNVPQLWQYCFIQGKDEMAYGRRSSTQSPSARIGSQAQSQMAVRIDIELARYMFSGAAAHVLG